MWQRATGILIKLIFIDLNVHSHPWLAAATWESWWPFGGGFVSPAPRRSWPGLRSRVSVDFTCVPSPLLGGKREATSKEEPMHLA